MDNDSDRIIPESMIYSDEVLAKLNEQLNTACCSIQTEDTEEALRCLQKSEDLLEAMVSHEMSLDPSLLVLTLHNKALCHQKLEDLEECASYLDGSVYNVENKLVFNSKTKTAAKIKRARYLSRSNLQLCAILSMLDNHESALLKARKAYRYAQTCVKKAHKFCETFVEKKAKSLKDEAGFKLFDLVLQKQEVFEYLMGKKKKANKINIDNLHFNIGNLMKIPLVLAGELQNNVKIKDELKNTCEIAVLFITSLFCIATELMNSPQWNFEAKSWHLRAYKIAKDLFPKDFAFREHICSTFKDKFKRKKLNATSVKRRPMSVRRETPKKGYEPKSQKTRFHIITENEQRRDSDRSSTDSQYFRDNFVMESNELYGNDSILYIDDDKNEYMPRSIDGQNWIQSSPKQVSMINILI